MKALQAILGAALLGAVVFAQESDRWRATMANTPRLQSFDVFVDTGRSPLAAYQLSIATDRRDVRIVAIDGGESTSFRAPPYYDRRALLTNHVILAAFSTDPAPRLPFGMTRVASIRVQVNGLTEPRFQVNLETAANANGDRIRASGFLQARH